MCFAGDMQRFSWCIGSLQDDGYSGDRRVEGALAHRLERRTGAGRGRWARGGEGRGAEEGFLESPKGIRRRRRLAGRYIYTLRDYPTDLMLLWTMRVQLGVLCTNSTQVGQIRTRIDKAYHCQGSIPCASFFHGRADLPRSE